LHRYSTPIANCPIFRYRYNGMLWERKLNVRPHYNKVSDAVNFFFLPFILSFHRAQNTA